ncbi:MAG: hypothetical protein P1V20_06375 [Verrucomicrobiales bacterium]|nr:hypothetical protein [Verrucomicrobiales bacterium]
MQTRPFFTVGITGHINLPEDSTPVLKQRLGEIFRWLRNERVPGNDKFGKPLGLEATPIVLLSPLAPGADQLAAEVALAEGIQVRCPLPFPVHLYRQSTSFTDDPAKTEERLATFDKTLAEIGPQNAFPVRHFDDEEPLSEDADWKIDDEHFRNLRYRATGEFVAAHCDILIAICNQIARKDLPDKDPDLTSRSFSGTRSITTSYINGLRPGILPIPPSLSWQENGPLIRIYAPIARYDKTAAIEVGDVAIWHSEDAKRHGDTGKKIHKREMNDLRDVAEGIEMLNRDLSKVSPDEKAVLKNLPDPEQCSAGIRGLFQFQNQVNQLARRNAKFANFLTTFSYIMGFIVFLCLAMAEGGRHIYLVVALLIFAGGVTARWFTKNVFGYFRKRDDYRTIAQGMTVQAYWASAGLAQSVASNYLQRLRGDISWIRSAIDSLIFPCDRFLKEFNELKSHRERHRRFSEILDLWIKREVLTLGRKTYLKSRTREVLGILGYTCLTAGVVLMAIKGILEAGFLAQFRPSVEFALRNYGVSIWYIWAAVLFVLASIFIGSETRFRFSFREKTSVRKLSYDLKVFSFFTHWAFRLFCGIALGFIIYSLALAEGLSENWMRLIKATLIALGGLWIAYSNTIFASEDAKRYADMLGQFSAARRKIGFILAEYHEMIERETSEDELTRMQKGIQELFFTLGREALHEQIETLLMRRSRPVEPVAKIR